ncbi:hypothetical protein HUF15_40355 [Streptomyces samsunensis]|uniref:hypothetical protein n=1 Tax=Streptomyces malaysiensis TaxID=92644 RepID=UPI001582E83D|nr:hypothetical protein [Streptomyces samsunensis]NUH42876.1 hypothetical protein [Streptomyces samsunensis]
MAIVIDAKNEMKKSVDNLDNRVSELGREVRTAVAAELAELRDTSLADLKTSQQEAQRNAYNAGKRTSETATAVNELRRDVDQLRQDLGEVLALLRATTPAAADGALKNPHRAQPGPGDELGRERTILPGQRPAPEEEPAPAAADTPAPAVHTPASLAEPAQVDSTLTDKDTEQPTSEAQEQTAGESIPREEPEEEAALEAGARISDEAPLEEPDPISWAGRIWAIMRAGRVSSATLVCHRDTWDFVAAQVGNHPHFKTPALEERSEGMVAAVLSGRSLVAMLLSLYHVAEVARRGEDMDELVAYADWAMASQVYGETAKVLSRAVHSEGDPVVVTIDNRLSAARTAAATTPAA